MNWNYILEQNQRENWCLFIPVLHRATLPPHLVIPEKTQQHHQRRKTVKNEKMSNHVIAMKWHSMFTEKGRSKSWTHVMHSLIAILKDLWLVRVLPQLIDHQIAYYTLVQFYLPHTDKIRLLEHAKNSFHVFAIVLIPYLWLHLAKQISFQSLCG